MAALGGVNSLRGFGLPVNPEDIDKSIDFAVLLQDGKVFYTGGQETAASVVEQIDGGHGLMGSFDHTTDHWVEFYPNAPLVIGVMALHFDSESDVARG